MASLAAFKKLKRHSVVVYINTELPSSYYVISPLVYGGFNTKRIGRIIPKAVMSSLDQTQIYASMSYDDIKGGNQFSKVSKKVKGAMSGEITPANFFDPKKLRWKIKDTTRSYEGGFVKLKNDSTVVLNIKGNNQDVQMSKLSDGAQNYARMLDSQASGKPGDLTKEKAAAKPLSTENWHSATGNKSIKATFVSLKGGKITLKKSNGKTMTFSIDKLSAESQERANELSNP